MTVPGIGCRLRILAALSLVALSALIPVAAQSVQHPGGAGRVGERFLDRHLLITWYGNPWSSSMGVLGEASGAARADALRRQAQAYATLTTRAVVPAYHLVAVVAQPHAGTGGTYRRRENRDVIQAVIREAREQRFLVILDVQPGRAPLADELAYLERYLAEPDVHLALDPEFAMGATGVPGRSIGSLAAATVNTAIDFLDELVIEEDLPSKVLIVHQFTLGMLPDKRNIRRSPHVDLVLNMDGFGSQSLKRSTYAAVMRQQLDFAGVKLFYRQDTGLFTPAQVLGLRPQPVVVIYQ